MDRVYEVHPIAVARTPFREKSEAPIQGVYHPDTCGRVELWPQYAAGLADIEGFSHLILLYAFDRAGAVDLKPTPFLDDDAHGVFATRHPRRPNHIGMTVVSLDRREGHTLHVCGIDVLDGTPILDIKPYMPRFDSFPEAREGWLTDRRERPKPAGRE